jgi:hypothetical protein
MEMVHTKLFHSKALQNLPKLVFLFENIPSGSPACKEDKDKPADRLFQLFLTGFALKIEKYLIGFFWCTLSPQFATRGRCYDHNCLRFLPIFGETFGIFLKKQYYWQKFAYFSFVLSQKRQFFAFFSGKIL